MKQIQTTGFILLILLSLLLSSNGIKAQQESVRSTENETSWFKKGDWLGGLILQPHKSTDIHGFAKQYQANKAGWDKAFAFLKDHNPDSLKNGNYVIDGENVFADVTDNPSSELKDAKWHSHGQYCDIIYVIKGTEKTGIAPISTAPVIIPFNGKGDSQFYDQNMNGTYYASNPDTFLILLPTDVHRPFIKVEGCTYVKRIRFKIKSGL